jgi:hypothetical protein
MTALGKIRTFIIHWRIYLSRGITYLSLINSSMILFLFLSRLKEVGLIHANIDNYFVSLLVLGIASLTFLGWFEVRKLRVFSEESRTLFNLDPCHRDMNEKLDTILEKLK